MKDEIQVGLQKSLAFDVFELSSFKTSLAQIIKHELSSLTTQVSTMSRVFYIRAKLGSFPKRA